MEHTNAGRVLAATTAVGLADIAHAQARVDRDNVHAALRAATASQEAAQRLRQAALHGPNPELAAQVEHYTTRAAHHLSAVPRWLGGAAPETPEGLAVAALRELRIELETSPGINRASVERIFTKYQATLRDALAALVRRALAPAGSLGNAPESPSPQRPTLPSQLRPQTIRKWILTELETIDGKGGLTYQVTLVQVGSARGFVREGLAGDRFMISSNERWKMHLGEGISSKLQQVLYVAAEPAHWASIADAVQQVERENAAHAKSIPRAVLKNRRWTIKSAESALAIHLWREATASEHFELIASDRRAHAQSIAKKVEE